MCGEHSSSVWQAPDMWQAQIIPPIEALNEKAASVEQGTTKEMQSKGHNYRTLHDVQVRSCSPLTAQNTPKEEKACSFQPVPNSLALSSLGFTDNQAIASSLSVLKYPC